MMSSTDMTRRGLLKTSIFGAAAAGAAGIAAAVFFSCLMAAIAKPKEKS